MFLWLFTFFCLSGRSFEREEPHYFQQWFQVAFKLHAMVRVLTFGVESVYNVRVKKNELEC